MKAKKKIIVVREEIITADAHASGEISFHLYYIPAFIGNETARHCQHLVIQCVIIQKKTFRVAFFLLESPNVHSLS